MLNKVTLMGRLTANPELRHTQSGRAVASFTLAVNRDFKGPDGQTATDFINVIAWGPRGEFASKYFVKGQLVACVGRLEVRNWEDKNGNKRQSYEVNAEELHFAEAKRSTSDFQSNQQVPRPQAMDFNDDEYSEISDDDGDLPF